MGDMDASEHPRTLLLVEDEALIALAQKVKLEEYGYEVLIAHTGEEAVAAVAEYPRIDLVLMDIDLGPGMTGADAAGLILQSRHIPIVFLTSHSEREYVEKVKEITRYGYVIKNSGEFVLWDAIEVAFELYEANAELERFFAVNPDLLCIADESGRFLKVNKAWEEILGYSVEELERSSFLDFVHPADLPATREAMVRLASQHDVTDFVNRYRCRDGSYRFIEWRSHPSGTTVYAAARDITKRMETENALRESEEKYRSLFERAPVGIFRTTSRGEALTINFAMANMLGFEDPEAALAHYANLGSELYVSADRRDQFLRELQESGSIQDFEYEAYRADGQTIWISMDARISERHDDGSFLIEGFATDVTERRRVQDVLSRHAATFEMLAENSSDAIFQVDAQLHAVYASPSAKDVLGYSADDFFDRSVIDVVYPEDRPGLEEELARVIREHSRTLSSEYRVITKGGQVRWVETRARLTYDSEGLFNGGVYRQTDITERKKRRKDQRFLADAARELNEYTAGTIDHQRITDHMREVSGAKYLALNIFERNGRDFTTTAMSGPRKELSRAASLLGFNVVGRRWKHDPIRERRIADKKTTVFETLGELADNAIAGGVTNLVAATFGLGKAVVVKTSKDNRPLGDFTLLLEKNGKLKNRALVEMYADMVGMVLHRIETEERNLELIREKETLLKETHHRIKNNMNTLMALLEIQANTNATPEASEALRAARGRVQSMTVLYDRLYQSGKTTAMSMKEYLGRLAEEVLSLFPNRSAVTLETAIEDRELDTRTLSAIGTIMNELLTNAMKHAFPNERTGTIRVSASIRDGKLLLEVADNGVGLPDSSVSGEHAGSGLNLVNLLAQQLDGHVNVDSNDGTRFSLELRVQP